EFRPACHRYSLRVKGTTQTMNSFRHITAVAFALITLALQPALAVDILVGTDAQLRTALGNGPGGAVSGDRILFTANITLLADLPVVGVNVSILGNNHTLNGNNQFRGFFIGGFS